MLDTTDKSLDSSYIRVTHPFQIGIINGKLTETKRLIQLGFFKEAISKIDEMQHMINTDIVPRFYNEGSKANEQSN